MSTTDCYTMYSNKLLFFFLGSKYPENWQLNSQGEVELGIEKEAPQLEEKVVVYVVELLQIFIP